MPLTSNALGLSEGLNVPDKQLSQVPSESPPHPLRTWPDGQPPHGTHPSVPVDILYFPATHSRQAWSLRDMDESDHAELHHSLQPEAGGWLVVLIT